MDRIVADRRAVWSARLSASTGTETVRAEHDGRLVGFIHVIFDEDPQRGSLVVDLHVVDDRRRTGLGTRRRGTVRKVRRAWPDAAALSRALDVRCTTVPST